MAAAAATSVALATAPGNGSGQITGVRKASDILAEHLHMDARQMVDVIKAQCFKGSRPDQITNEQLAQYISVANSLQAQAPGFNPLLNGMLYAFPSKNGGIEPMIGPDGLYAILGSRPDVDGWETTAELDANGELVSANATIWVRGRARPFTKRVYLREWRVGTNPNWVTRPIHMLETRALKQCARQVIHGLPFDPDEARIAAATEVPFENVPPRLAGPVPVVRAEQAQDSPAQPQPATNAPADGQEAAQAEKPARKSRSAALAEKVAAPEAPPTSLAPSAEAQPDDMPWH